MFVNVHREAGVISFRVSDVRFMIPPSRLFLAPTGAQGEAMLCVRAFIRLCVRP